MISYIKSTWIYPLMISKTKLGLIDISRMQTDAQLVENEKVQKYVCTYKHSRKYPLHKYFLAWVQVRDDSECIFINLRIHLTYWTFVGTDRHFRHTGHVYRLTNLSMEILSQKNCIFNQNLYCGLIVILHNTLSAFWLSTGSWSKKFGDARKWNNSGRLMHYKKSKKTLLVQESIMLIDTPFSFLAKNRFWKINFANQRFHH